MCVVTGKQLTSQGLHFFPAPSASTCGHIIHCHHWNGSKTDVRHFWAYSFKEQADLLFSLYLSLRCH